MGDKAKRRLQEIRFSAGRTPGQRKFENSFGTPIAGTDKVWGNQEMVSPSQIHTHTRTLLGHCRWNGRKGGRKKERKKKKIRVAEGIKNVYICGGVWKTNLPKAKA